MTSGIYKLTFSNGSFYIGKSVDVERRWKEHFDKFAKGTAAKNMQYAFDMYGYPNRELLIEVHPDHIDLLEGWAIKLFSHGDMLNSASVSAPDPDDVELMSSLEINGENFLRLSTVQHAKILKELNKQYNALKTQLYEGDYGKLMSQRDYWIKVAVERQTEIDRLKNRSFFQRLFGG